MNKSNGINYSNLFMRLKYKIFPIMFFSIVASLLLETLSLLPVYLMPAIIDNYIPNSNYGGIFFSIAIYTIIPLISSLGYDYYQYNVVLKGRRLVTNINQECFDKIIHQPISFFDENYSAEIAKKCSQEINAYVCSWTVDIPQLISSVMMGIVIFVLLFKLHPLLAYIQCMFLPLVYLLMRKTGKRLQKLIEMVMKNNAKYQKDMQESFRSIRFIKSAQLEEQALIRVKSTQLSTLKIWGRLAFLDNFSSGITSKMLPSVFYGLTFTVAALLTAQGKITIGILSASLGYATKIHHVFAQLVKTYKEHKKSKGEVRIIEEYLNLSDERDVEFCEKWNFQASIIYKNLSFKYPKSEKYILKNINVEIKKGEWIGIIGQSGVGKTTVLELLVRFYDISDGNILVDNVDINEINLFDLRKHISYVSQDTYLVEGTIRDNLRLIPNALEEEIEKVAGDTGILATIEGGLNKQVGEGGMLLSGGEKQRIALARSILEKKEVLLLDEATSQLDEETQEKMAFLINRYRLAHNITVVSVAHRFEFNRYADKIINLDKKETDNE